MTIRVLFVCTGNTCRSPLAEALFKHLARESNLSVEVKSAGVSATQGIKPAAHTVAVLNQRQVPCDGESQPVSTQLIQWADLILTMTEGHKQRVWVEFPEARERVFTLKEFVNDAENKETLQDEIGYDISDPFGGSLSVYEACAAEIEEALHRLVAKLQSSTSQISTDVVE